MDWKSDDETRIDPPIYAECLASGGAMILTFLVGEAPASPVISFCTLSAIPLNIVEPPDKTILA